MSKASTAVQDCDVICHELAGAPDLEPEERKSR